MKVSLFQGILIGAFVLSAIVGVFVFASFQGGGPEDAIGSVTIWGTISKAQVESALGDAKQNDQSLKGVRYVQKSDRTFRNDLVSAIAEGNPPDMVLISQENLYSLMNVLQTIPSASLSERAFRDTYVSGAEIYLASTGGAYGVPFLIDPLVLFSNRTLLESTGIARPPTTWEAITGLVLSVVTKTMGGNIDRALIPLGTYQNIENARGILSALFLQAGVPLTSVTNSGLYRADFGTTRSGGKPPGQGVVSFYTQFADPAKTSYTWNASIPGSRAYFLSGDAALYVGYASEAGYFSQANPNLDFDVSPIPQLETSGIKMTYGHVYAFAIPRSSGNQTGALMAAMTLAKAGPAGTAARETSMAPALRSLLASPPTSAAPAVAYASALYTKTWLSPAPLDTDAVFSTMITNVITGRLTLEAALVGAENSLEALLR